ncbi:MAG: FecR family protein [Thermodesulfobacteriota bacterium]
MKNGIWKYACLIFPALWLLITLSQDAFAQAGRGAGVSPEALPKALRDLSPKDFFISTNQKKVGVIHALEGKAVVVHRSTNEAFFAMEGDPVHENDVLHTLADSRCRIRFLDEDVVTMAPDTEFSIESFQDQRAEGKKTSLFSMARGKAMFYAMRLFRYRDTRFTLNTPTVTVGVRGTKFGVDVYFVGEEKMADRGIQVADAGNELAPYLAQAGGPQSFTNAFSEDGVLNVAGQIVGPGQMFNGQTNQIIPTPPDVIRSFQQATGMGVQGQQARATPPPAGTVVDTQTLTGTAAQQNQGATADLTNLVTNQTSVQSGAQTEQAGRSDQIVPYTGTLYGYFGTLLRKNSPEAFRDALLNYQSTFAPGITGVNNNEDPLTDLRMHGIINTSDYIDFSGSSTSPDTANIGGSSTNFLPGHFDGIITYVGQNAYAQWGHWKSTVDTSFTITGGAAPGTYSVVNDQTWFVEAKYIATTTDIAAVPTGDYAYGGVAHGTYYNGSASARMDGTFSSTVHFGSASVKSFNLNVSGGGHSASLAWTGTQTISTSSSGNYFAIESGLNPKIDGSTVSYGKVAGSLVGAGAEGMIGAWGAGCASSGIGAAGIYSGTR